MKHQVPSELLWVADSPVVRMVEIDESDCHLPFWSQTLSRNGRTVRLLPLDRVEEDCGRSIQVKGFIYHVNRCGSTLVANAFKSVGKRRVLSEPFVFQQLLDNQRGTSAQRQSWLRKLIALHQQALCTLGEELIIKWPSLLTLHAGQIESAFPTTPAVFLYRNPVEVLVSIQRDALGGTEFTRAEHLGDARDLDINLQIVAGDLRINALYIAHVCRKIVEANCLIAVDYAALPSAICELIAPHFRIPLTEAERNTIDKTSRIYSKDPRAKATHLPDSEAKQREATPEIRTLAAEIILPALNKALTLLNNKARIGMGR